MSFKSSICAKKNLIKDLPVFPQCKISTTLECFPDPGFSQGLVQQHFFSLIIDQLG